MDDVRGAREDARGERERMLEMAVAILVPVGLSNRYQWMSKAPGEKPGVLDRDQWSQFGGTDCKTGA